MIAKVRHGKVYITLDVPEDTFLEYWANAPYLPLPGCVVFFQTKGGAARETLSWEQGHCVGYSEEFEEGSSTTGSYVCHLVIAAPKLTMSPGGPPQPFVAPAPREHGTPPQEGFLNVLPLLPPPTVITPFEVPVAETMAEVAARLALKTLEVAVPVSLTLALVFGTITPAQAPGLPHLPLVPVDPDKARLADLIAKHAAGTLTANEEAELIELLAKVKGIHIQRLADLNAFGTLRGNTVSLPGFHNIQLSYTKRPAADLDALRRKFGSSVREKFLKKVGNDPVAVQQLRTAGLSESDIKRVTSGKCPIGYQVHHRLPLDDGGDNSFDNLMLIKNDPYHLVVTNVQNTLTGDLQAGQTRIIQWPMYNGVIYPPQP